MYFFAKSPKSSLHISLFSSRTRCMDDLFPCFSWKKNSHGSVTHRISFFSLCWVIPGFEKVFHMRSGTHAVASLKLRLRPDWGRKTFSPSESANFLLPEVVVSFTTYPRTKIPKKVLAFIQRILKNDDCRLSKCPLSVFKHRETKPDIVHFSVLTWWWELSPPDWISCLLLGVTTTPWDLLGVGAAAKASTLHSSFAHSRVPVCSVWVR